MNLSLFTHSPGHLNLYVFFNVNYFINNLVLDLLNRGCIYHIVTHDKQYNSVERVNEVVKLVKKSNSVLSTFADVFHLLNDLIMYMNTLFN